MHWRLQKSLVWLYAATVRTLEVPQKGFSRGGGRLQLFQLCRTLNNIVGVWYIHAINLRNTFIRNSSWSMDKTGIDSLTSLWQRHPHHFSCYLSEMLIIDAKTSSHAIIEEQEGMNISLSFSSISSSGSVPMRLFLPLSFVNDQWFWSWPQIQTKSSTCTCACACT